MRLWRESGRPLGEVAEQLGVSHQSIRNWEKELRVESGESPGLMRSERDELKELRKKAKALEAENTFLKKGRS